MNKLLILEAFDNFSRRRDMYRFIWLMRLFKYDCTESAQIHKRDFEIWTFPGQTNETFDLLIIFIFHELIWKLETFRIFLSIDRLWKLVHECSTSCSGGNQVDGLPPVSSLNSKSPKICMSRFKSALRDTISAMQLNSKLGFEFLHLVNFWLKIENCLKDSNSYTLFLSSALFFPFSLALFLSSLSFFL